MKNLFKYLKLYIKESILGPFFKLLEALFELYVPIVVANIIDKGINAGNTDYIVKQFILLIVLAIIGIVSSLTAQFFAAKAAVGCTGKLRYALFEKIHALSLSDIDKIGIPTLITRLTGDLNQVQNGINLSLRLLLRSPFVVFGAMIMAFTINARAALIFFGVIVVLAVVVFSIILGSVPAYKRVQGNLDKLTGTVRENLTGVRVIRAFGMYDDEEAKFNEYNNTLNRCQQFAGKISALMNPLTFVLLNTGIILLLQYSGARVNSGVLTTGEVVALYNYMTQILVELVKFANLIITISKSISSMNRISDIIDTSVSMSYPEESKPEIENAPVIEFKNVKLNYSGGDPALEDISFVIEKGETVGIIGGTGSGKTSVVNLITRFYDVTEGSVMIDGVDVRDYDAKTLRSKIGYVLQKASLFGGTIRDNIKWGNPDATDEEIEKAIEYAQAKDVVASKSDGLSSQIEQNGRNLSGGQRQRLTIARALVRKPKILILDDSASALDFATDAALRGAIASLDYSPTTVIVSQRTSSIMHADKIIVLDDGRICGVGTHAVLLDSCPVYREIYESQYKKEV